MPPTACRRGERALVLGGGGSTGNAWLIGVVAGLSEGGLDVTAADLTVGTSAGSTAAAQLAGASAGRAARRHPGHRLPARGPDPDAPTRLDPAGDGPPGPDARGIIDAAEDADDLRRTDVRGGSRPGRRVGRHRAGTVARHRRLAAAQPALAGSGGAHHGGRRRDGEPVVFDRHSGVDLADAVAASCSSGPRLPDRAPPVHRRRLPDERRERRPGRRIRERAGAVAVRWPDVRTPGVGHAPRRQVDALRAGGSRVEAVSPDSTAEHLFGVSSMDPSLRPPAARAGHAHGRAVADQLAELWR